MPTTRQHPCRAAPPEPRRSRRWRYELYEGQIKLRELKSDYAEKDRLYKAALLTLPRSEGLASIAALDLRIAGIASQKEEALLEIANVDSHVATEQSQQFVAGRRVMQEKLRRLASDLQGLEQRINDLTDENLEIHQFIEHLRNQLASLNVDEILSQKLGTIEFQYCPACLKPLEAIESKYCIVCHEVIDEDKAKSKYFEIKLDNELQIRESQQLLASKAAEIENLANELRAQRREYSAAVTEFSGRYDVTNSPRESFLAERNKLVGRLEQELSYLEELSVHANHELPNSLADIAGVETFETKKFSCWRLLVRVQQAHDLMHGNVRVLNVRSFRYSGPPE